MVISRKVQRAGYSSLSVSLPIDWAKDVDLKPGDVVFITQEEDSSLKLMLKTQPSVAETEEFVIYADKCNEPGMLLRVVVGNYLLARDTLRIISEKRIQSAHIDEVRKITRRLIGISIIEETPNQIILQCSIDPSKFEMNTLLRRLSIIALTMLDEAIQAVLEFNSGLAKDVIYREDEANAMYWLIVRLLNSAQRVKSEAEKIGLEKPWQALDIRLISKCIENVADCAESIAKRVDVLEKSKNLHGNKVIERLRNFGKLTCDVYKTSMECVFKGDIKDANSVLEMKETLEEEEELLLISDLPRLYNSIISCLTRIVENSATIAAIAFREALEKPSSYMNHVNES